MKALVKESLGPGQVSLQELPPPRVESGQVMIRVEAAGICGSDLHILHGDIKLNLRPPVVMGHEFCGVVEEVAEDVASWQPGDRVSSETTFRSCGECLHCCTGNYNLCSQKELIGYVHNGCFARYCVVPAQRVHRLPENVSYEQGALCEPLACCVHAVMEKMLVQPGETVVVAGVGAIGLLCAQVARACGGKVIVCGTEEDGPRFAVARKLDIKQTVNVDKEDTLQAVRAATNGEGADVFLECSGAPAAARLGLSLLRRGGRFCQVGLFGRAFEIDFEQITYKELHIAGSLGSRWTSWRSALRVLSTAQVKTGPLIGEPLALSKWQEAFRRFENREGIKILLRPE